LTYPRRKPSRIALELLNCLDEKEGRASKWDLIKILGNESQFHYWVEDFCLRKGLLLNNENQIVASTEKLKLASFCTSY